VNKARTPSRWLRRSRRSAVGAPSPSTSAPTAFTPWPRNSDSHPRRPRIAHGRGRRSFRAPWSWSSWSASAALLTHRDALVAVGVPFGALRGVRHVESEKEDQLRDP